VKTEAERTALERAPDAKPSGRDHKNPVLRFLGELPGLVIMALILAILIKTFLFQAFFIPSASMEPTLHGCDGCSGDRVLVTKIPYYFSDPKRGDIVVFSNPDPQKRPDRGFVGGVAHWLAQAVGVQKPDDEDFIKRVIGLPGDKVWGAHGKVYVNGIAIAEPYLPDSEKTAPFPAQRVPKDSYFVMGDNRSNSLDSRFGLGFVPRDAIIGKAFFIVWPPSRWTTL
jgi:signal peptidase I